MKSVIFTLFLALIALIATVECAYCPEPHLCRSTTRSPKIIPSKTNTNTSSYKIKSTKTVPKRTTTVTEQTPTVCPTFKDRSHYIKECYESGNGKVFHKKPSENDECQIDEILCVFTCSSEMNRSFFQKEDPTPKHTKSIPGNKNKINSNSFSQINAFSSSADTKNIIVDHVNYCGCLHHNDDVYSSLFSSAEKCNKLISEFELLDDEKENPISSAIMTTTTTSTTTSTTTTKTIPITTSVVKTTKCLPVTVTVTEKEKVTITEKETITVTIGSQSTPENCATKWAQCGGVGFNGPTCCQSGTTCQFVNEYYSQCL